MVKSRTTPAARAEQIEQAIRVVRGQRVMLDADLARLYGVRTAALNQAQNSFQFPLDSYDLIV